jgi:hypothetical protein
MLDSWMWVPGPGAYFDAGPRSWPGRAIEGRAIVVVEVEILNDGYAALGVVDARLFICCRLTRAI